MLKQKKYKAFLKKLLRIVQPHVEVGGLEITDARLSFFSIHPESNSVRRFSVPLEKGTLREGVIKNKDAFIRAVASLKNAITPHTHRDIPVVVVISDANVFTQTFSLPAFVDGSFQEAVRLNMETISPIDFSKAYSDWEYLGSHNDELQEIEVIASFISKTIIDDIVSALQGQGFSIVAIEQRSMAYARFIEKYESSFTPQKSYLLLHVGGDGITLGVLCKGHLYFSKFSSWETIIKEADSPKELAFSDLMKILVREIHQVSNFFIGRSQEPVSGVYVASEAFGSNIQQSLQDKFPFPVYSLSAAPHQEDVAWIISAGGALRGLIPRSADEHISLTPERTKDMLIHSQVISFMETWRNIFIAVGVVILIAYVGVYSFLNAIIGSIANDLNTSITPASVTRFNELKKQAELFNNAVARAQVVHQNQRRWYDLLAGIYAQTGPSILIDRIYTQSESTDITISARGMKEEDAITFRRRIEALPQVASVELPLTSITQTDANTVTFKLIIKAK